MSVDHDPIRASDAVIARLRALHPSLIDLTTGRVERLLHALGDPHMRMGPVIHVAGTNGKGSTCAFLCAMAEAAGLKVHVLTSPHLVRFAERIRIAGRLISDEALAARITEVEEANAGQPISFFEITTALALYAFGREPADLVILEVGLGGRFDATNVIPAPAVSVITPVDYDHVEMLGPTLEKIAWEKAGIIKAGRPVVSARQREEAREVICAEAETLGAPMIMMGEAFDAWEAGGRLCIQAEDRFLDLPPPGLVGPHQAENAALAAMALITFDPAFDEGAIARGVASATWAGRFQRLKTGPLGRMAEAAGADLWLDGGHNPHGARALAEACARFTARDGRPWTFIVGMLGRKDATGFFEALKPLAPQVLTTGFDSPNAMAPETLAEAAEQTGVRANACANLEDALADALDATPPPHVMICGSLHFIGDALAKSEDTWPT